jgi:carbonic anhydrase/acetyltransferase-like protein (isoleucine patch superfamily)
MKLLARLFVVLLPWPVRRWVLNAWYGYQLAPGSHIGLAWVFPRRLAMARGARIGHFTVVKGLDVLEMGQQSSIGRLNWISAFPTGTGLPHFAHLRDRRAELSLEEHSAITNRHIVDCTERVAIGRFATLAGFRSQILTHSIDLRACRQHASPVRIGQYCFVGTACTILGGGDLPDHSVLGAHSLLNKAHTTPYRLYAGVPATAIKELSPDLAYFSREQGFVN